MEHQFYITCAAMDSPQSSGTDNTDTNIAPDEVGGIEPYIPNEGGQYEPGYSGTGSDLPATTGDNTSGDSKDIAVDDSVSIDSHDINGGGSNGAELMSGNESAQQHGIEIKFLPETLDETLPIMAKGVAGVMLTIGVIMCVVYLLNVLFKSKSNTK